MRERERKREKEKERERKRERESLRERENLFHPKIIKSKCTLAINCIQCDQMLELKVTQIFKLMPKYW